MKLRPLQLKDAPCMHEWMRDENVIGGLHRETFINKTLSDCESFILASQDMEKNCNMAVVDENDEYMGTVSLKNINPVSKDAEFAIAMRSCAMGKGLSSFAIKEIISLGFRQYGLELIYWNVLKTNSRAIRFYEKNGYNLIDSDKLGKRLNFDDEKYLWFAENP